MPIDLKKYWNWQEFRFWFSSGVVVGVVGMASYLYFPKEKDWIDGVTALIAPIGLLIAYLQFRISQEGRRNLQYRIMQDFVDKLLEVHSKTIGKPLTIISNDRELYTVISKLPDYAALYAFCIDKQAGQIMEKYLEDAMGMEPDDPAFKDRWLNIAAGVRAHFLHKTKFYDKSDLADIEVTDSESDSLK